MVKREKVKFILGLFIMTIPVVISEITPVPVFVVLLPAWALTTYIFYKGA